VPCAPRRSSLASTLLWIKPAELNRIYALDDPRPAPRKEWKPRHTAQSIVALESTLRSCNSPVFHSDNAERADVHFDSEVIVPSQVSTLP
jgi:hypothetical protein